MRKLVCCAAMLCMLLLSFACAEKLVLPDMLTRIEEEAFFDCDDVRGVVKLPESVKYIGARAFGRTQVFALQIIGGQAEIAPDAFDELSYIFVYNTQTQLPSELIAKAKYLFALPGTQVAEGAAQEQINADMLLQNDGFYYEMSFNDLGEGTLRLLCAVDGTLPETVTIPARVEGFPVTEVAEDAFWGCEGLTTVLVPEKALIEAGTEKNLPSGALQTYKPSPLETPEINSIYSNANTVQITWLCGMYDELPVTGYDIWRCSTQDGDYEKVATLSRGADVYYMSWTDENLPLGSTWYYKLQSFAQDGTVRSNIGGYQKVTVSDTMLKMATLRILHNGDSCTVQWEDPEGAEVLRTDVYRSMEYSGEFKLIASVGVGENSYTDAAPEIFGKDSVYYKVQQHARINGVEWTSQMTSARSVGLELYDIDWAFYYEEGVRVSVFMPYTNCYRLYRAEAENGPWQKLYDFTVEPDDNEEYGYVYAYHLIPADQLENGGYFSICAIDENGAAQALTNPLQIPAWNNLGVVIEPDKTSCETGDYINWKTSYSREKQRELRISWKLLMNNEAVTGLCGNVIDGFNYLTKTDGIYCLVGYLNRLDGGESTTVVASSEIQASTVRGCPHPYYYADLREYWFDGEAGSGYQLLTFSEATLFGSGDQAVIYDEWGTELYSYTGRELAGKTITVRGSGAGVRIDSSKWSDSSRGFGFAIVDMVSMPYLDLQGVSITSDRSTAATNEEIVWTAEVKNGCVPFNTKWDIYLDGELYDTLNQSGLTLTYYPMEAGEYTAVAVVSDHRSKATVSGGSCKVEQKQSEAGLFTYQNNGYYIILTGYTGSETTVVVPDTIESLPVREIAYRAFAATTARAWILPDSIEKICGGAFADSAAVEIRLPQNPALYLESSALSSTQNLRRITLPEGITTLPDYCFSMSGIHSINIPSSVTSIGENCFSYSSLTGIHIPANVKTLGISAFENCEELSTLTFAQKGLTAIPNYCFEGCKSLKNIVLPKTVKSIGNCAFKLGETFKPSFTIWIGSETTDIVSAYMSDLSFSGCTIYAPEDSYAANYARSYQGDSFAWATLVYGGTGCDDLFSGEHDYEPISDILLLDTETGLHMHDVVYKCYRCGVEKAESQVKTALGCWRCEAKEAYGAAASIPMDKFEFMGRFKLSGKIYYRIRLLEMYKGVKQGAEALFMDEMLKMVTDEETLKYLFRIYMYTGEGTLPWEYTDTTDDYPSLERRKEHAASAANTAANHLKLAEEFIKMDECNKLIGEVASNALKALWGNPADALKSIAKSAVPDMDALLVATQVYILQHLAETMEEAADYYEYSLNGITDAQGFILCEKAEDSLVAFADVMGMYRLCVDNGSPIIEEIAQCGNAFGVGVRNIITMLKGAAGDDFIGKLGTFVTDKLFKAFTSDDFDADPNAMYGVSLIGEMSELLSAAVDNKLVSAWLNLYKSGQFALTEVLYMDSAFEHYEKNYNAFCLKGTILQETHRILAED